ncbi:hypothetical protein [Salibaculum griseiflavum]|uniref:Uncharacterized protein n=1 Tax=Salibaculum griseiflavum TaxID=1914409 RepID=A0A2V1PCM5_9RHOB|nr:hypothetical protein [Salibaculum griseiflavum]PWG18642.1 hypothetical protein DFK10_01620 [Salibaculum griseiflavum]
MRFAVVCLLVATPVFADPPSITDATARGVAGGWTFAVTIAHPDAGWDHYADGWRVELDDGTILGTRVLAHPHVREQPFTRSLSGVEIPPGTTTVFLRAKCLVDGWNTETTALALP